jgi:hypothetical protein
MEHSLEFPSLGIWLFITRRKWNIHSRVLFVVSKKLVLHVFAGGWLKRPGDLCHGG